MIAAVAISTLLFNAAAAPVVVDRIAVVVGKRAIKTSDIDREVRITDLVNGDPLKLNAESREKAVARLIDQELIRREIEAGGYGLASDADVERFVAELKRQRFPTGAAYSTALTQYGVTDEQLRRHLRWQLTVLEFIEQRFRPGVIVTDQDVAEYVRRHSLSKTSAAPAAAERKRIEDEIAGERVNQLFEEWLTQTRKQANPRRLPGVTE